MYVCTYVCMYVCKAIMHKEALNIFFHFINLGFTGQRFVCWCHTKGFIYYSHSYFAT